MPNEVTVKCIRNVLHDTEAVENARAGADASALISGTQPSANALVATPAPVGKKKPHHATRNGKQLPKPKPHDGRDREQQQPNKRRKFEKGRDRLCRHCGDGRRRALWDPDCQKKPCEARGRQQA